MANRPDNTYVSQVFNFGIDKNLPLGFVNVVYSKETGNVVGYEKEGKFYNLGEKIPKKVTEPQKRKTYTGSIEERVTAIEREAEEARAAKADSNARAATSGDQRARAAQGDLLDNYATSLKPRLGELGFQIEAYARKIARGDKLSVIEEKELKRFSDEYAKLNKTYNEARSDALEFYYGTQSEPATQTGKKTVLTSAKTAQTQTGGPTGTPVRTPTPTPEQTPLPEITTGVTTDKTSGGRTGGTNIPGVTTDKTSGGKTGGITSITGSGKAIPSNFDVGSFRMADEASMAAAEGIVSGTGLKTYDQALANVQEKYNLPDILFSQVKSLGDLLDRYVNAKKYGKDGIADIGKFVELVKIDPWYRANEGEIKTRYIQKFNYDDLVKSGKATGNTNYEQEIRRITDDLMVRARKLGSAIDEGQAKLIAEDLYIHNQDKEETTLTRRLVSGIRPIAGMIGGKITEDYSGLALQNYQGLQEIARRNGMKLENILPRDVTGKPMSAQETLQRLALGEIDPTRLEQDVRKLAAVGQPQFVRDLLGQGIDLDEIYSPYRKTMSRILELDPGQIDLMDPTLRMGINDKGDVNLYDYEKALRQDSRWQYTGNAREAVSDGALTVLRNFGFQG
jgi:hypothetical protein